MAIPNSIDSNYNTMFNYNNSEDDSKTVSNPETPITLEHYNSMCVSIFMHNISIFKEVV